MTLAALLALILGVPSTVVTAPPDVPDEVRRWADSSSPYNPAPPRPLDLPDATTGLAVLDDTTGRAGVDGTAGHTTLDDARDVSGFVALLDGNIGAPIVAPASSGLLYEPAYAIDVNLCGPTAPYVPQPGDIVLVVSDHLIWELMFAEALLHEPYHVAIVVRMPDGSFGMLEAGPPDRTTHVRICPLAERLASEPGRVFIRRRCVPLTAEQSEALTGFALRQDGKPYDYIRFLAQGTPFRSRGPIRTQFMGKSRGEPCSYFCSELVIEALVSAGLIDPCTARPRATAPMDIFYDESPNPWLNTYLKLYPWWCPPQRWVAGRCGQ